MVVVNYMNKENFLLGHLFKVSDLAPEVLLIKKETNKEGKHTKLPNPKRLTYKEIILVVRDRPQ